MADLLRTGVEWLAQKRAAHCASAESYRRFGQADQSVVATYGRTDVEVADESGLTIIAHVWDFLINVESLALEPEPGDVIIADGRRYEVMRLGGGGCWRWSDSYRVTMRIHTKDVGANE